MVTRAGPRQLEERVVRAAESALAEKQYVTAVDVLVGLGWLPQSRVDGWRQGRVPALETAVTANLSKISAAMATFPPVGSGSGAHAERDGLCGP